MTGAGNPLSISNLTMPLEPPDAPVEASMSRDRRDVADRVFSLREGLSTKS